MLGSGKFDLSGGDGNQFTHEQNVDSVENDSDNVLGLSNLFKLGNIGLFDGSDSTFGFLEIRKGNFEISVSLRSFDLNLISLFLTSDGNTVDFLRFLIGVPVLNLELLQKFVGALAGQRAKKGVFITTSYFTKEAIEYARQMDTKIVLIDGEKLSQYMIDYNLGVSVQNVYEIKKIDSDYFEEE